MSIDNHETGIQILTITVRASTPDPNTVVGIVESSTLVLVVMSPWSAAVGAGCCRCPLQGLELAENRVCQEGGCNEGRGCEVFDEHREGFEMCLAIWSVIVGMEDMMDLAQ